MTKNNEKTIKKLTEENEQLKQTNKKFRALEQQIRASNQQLIASEQQLRAANQQLRSAEEQITEERNKYKNLIENVPDAIYSALPQKTGIITFMSDRWQDWTGCTTKDIYNDYKIWLRSIHPDERDKIIQEMEQAIKKKKEYNLEYKVIHKDTKEIYYLRDHGVPIKNKKGKIIKYDGVITDITKRKKTEDALQKSEKKFRSIIENLPMGIHMYELTSKEQLIFTGANPEADKILGIDNKQFIGKNIHDAFPQISKTDIPKKFHNIAKHGGFWHKEDIMYKDNLIGGAFENFNFQTSPNTMVSLFNNITERKQAEQKIKWLAELPGENPSPILRVSKNGIIVYANKASDVLLKAWKCQVNNPLPDYWRKFAKEALQTGISKTTEITCNEFSFSLTFTPIIDANYVNIYGFNITELKKAEGEKEKVQIQLLQSQKLEAIGTLAGGVAHDFNNILTSVRGNVNLAMMDIQKTDDLYEFLEDIDLCVSRAASLTKQLLIFSRKQPMGFTTINLNDLIKNLLKMLNRLIGEDITIHTNIPSTLWRIKADEGNIEQVITNLTVNARDSMPKGGRITIQTKNVVLDKKQYTSIPEAKPGKYVCFIVKDTGIGMDENVLKHIYEPFFTTKEGGKGTGLGLAVIYGIIKGHKGWINVYSKVRQGSTFTIYLPACFPKEKKKIVKQNIPHNLYGNKEQILLVEDEEKIRKIITQILKKHNYIVFEAANVKEALEIFKKENMDFQMIMSDVVLPDKTGLDLVDQILLHNPNIGILLSSGYLDDKSQWEVIHKKGFKFIKKPFEIDELLIAIKEVIK